MATEAGAPEIGRAPGTSLTQDGSGHMTFEEQREDGTHKVTTVGPDGGISRSTERVHPSTGMYNKVERFDDGRVARTTEWPGGQRQTFTTMPDGSRVMHRTFQGQDGTSWSQTFDVSKDGEVRGITTSHDHYEPDGTFRHEVKNPDGSLSVTRTKTTKLEDGSEMTKVSSPNGDVMTRITKSDGTSETMTVHKDGSTESISVTKSPDGAMVTRELGTDGKATTTTEWTSPDGHQHRTIVTPDGKTQEFENWEERLPDNTTVAHRVSPGGTETDTIHPDGSREHVKQNADGSTTSTTHTKNPDGSITERTTRADGSTRESHYEREADGDYTTRVKEFDGTERTTHVGRDGRVEIQQQNPDGSRVESSYSADGTGRTDEYNANGSLHRSIPRHADPDPHTPSGYDPEEFVKEAERAMTEDIPIKDAVEPDQEIDLTATDAGEPAPLSETAAADLADIAVGPPVAGDATGVTSEAEAASAGVEGTPVGAEAGTGPMLDRLPPGPTMLSEDLPDGTHRSSAVFSDGSVSTITKRTDPSTGIETEVSRSPDGSVETTIDSPGGVRQVTREFPDGTTETFRAFPGPDGTQWSQFTGRDGGVQTTHQTIDPDGTLRMTQKMPDGSVEVTTSKTTEQPDGSVTTEVHAPNGDVVTSVSSLGRSESRVVHPDGTESVSTFVRDAEGKEIYTQTDESGAVTTTTKWTSADGHAHESTVHPDGRTETSEVFGEVLPDGTSTSTAISDQGTQTVINRPDGSFEITKTNADGTTESHTLIKNADGSAVEKQVRADGAVQETHYEQKSLDGSLTTVTRGFDGTETRTIMDENGRINVRAQNPDGTSVEKDLNADGSGRQVTLDADGNITSETAIQPVPPPSPRDFEPDRFFEESQSTWPQDIGAAAEAEPASQVLSDADIAALSERGIAPPPEVSGLDLDEAAVGAGFGAAMQVDPEDLTWDGETDPTVVDGPLEPLITPDPFPEETIWPEEEKIEGMEGEEELGVDPVAVDGPEESIITPEPYEEEQVWPAEEDTSGMEGVEEHEPIGPDPAVEQQEF